MSRKDEAHSRMAGRVLIGQIYKEAFGGFKKIPSLTEFYQDMVMRGTGKKWAILDLSC